MPIVEADPWRQQYFTASGCPDNVVVPTDDQLAYQLFPQHRWIYNKLLICETQGLDSCAARYHATPVSRVQQADLQSSRHGQRW